MQKDYEAFEGKSLVVYKIKVKKIQQISQNFTKKNKTKLKFFSCETHCTTNKFNVNCFTPEKLCCEKFATKLHRDSTKLFGTINYAKIKITAS